MSTATHYIVSLSEPFAILDDEDAMAFLLKHAGYDTIEEMAEEEETPELASMPAAELAEYLYGAELEPDLYDEEYLDEDGERVSREYMAEFTKEFINEMYGIIEIAGHIFDSAEILEEMAPDTFSDYVQDMIDDRCFGSWEEWHDNAN